MNIYFACSITGGRQDEAVYKTIVQALLAQGYEVPTFHLANPKVMTLETVVDPEEVFLRDIKWINVCDALVAEVSTPSHGVGYEIAYALSKDKPVICCSREGVKVSKMIIGNANPNFCFQTYHTPSEAVNIILEWLDELQNIV